MGGKTQLLPVLRAAAPARYGCHFEPFVGGGALFFALRPKVATLSDVNGELVNACGVVRDTVEGLIDLLGWHRHDGDFCYETRAQDPDALSPVERAARTIYLNETCLNGVYRVMSARPAGRLILTKICDADNLRVCSWALAGIAIVAAQSRAPSARRTGTSSTSIRPTCARQRPRISVRTRARASPSMLAGS